MVDIHIVNQAKRFCICFDTETSIASLESALNRSNRLLTIILLMGRHKYVVTVLGESLEDIKTARYGCTRSTFFILGQIFVSVHGHKICILIMFYNMDFEYGYYTGCF